MEHYYHSARHNGKFREGLLLAAKTAAFTHSLTKPSNAALKESELR